MKLIGKILCAVGAMLLTLALLWNANRLGQYNSMKYHWGQEGTQQTVRAFMDGKAIPFHLCQWMENGARSHQKIELMLDRDWINTNEAYALEYESAVYVVRTPLTNNPAQPSK